MLMVRKMYIQVVVYDNWYGTDCCQTKEVFCQAMTNYHCSFEFSTVTEQSKTNIHFPSIYMNLT